MLIACSHYAGRQLDRGIEKVILRQDARGGD